MTYDIFLSHNRKDKWWVRAFVDLLRTSGLKVFFDEDTIPYGVDIVRAIEQGLTDSNYVILILSEYSLSSRWVALESSISIYSDPEAQERKLIPISIEDIPVESLPLSIRRLHMVNLTIAEHAVTSLTRLLTQVGVYTIDQFKVSRLLYQLRKSLCNPNSVQERKSGITNLSTEEIGFTRIRQDQQDSPDQNLNDNLLDDDAHTISAQLRNHLANTDKRINEYLPERILSPARNNRLEVFSGEKIISSLVKLGIPIRVALTVLGGVEKHLREITSNTETITSAHIRRAVTHSIYSLDVKAFGAARIQRWGDSYARRYGNSDVRIKVLHPDGTEENLDYKFLCATLIPHLVEDILSFPFENVKDTVISRQNLDGMAAQILSYVKSLNLYCLRYSTLLSLAADLALQPPHPWFVDSAFSNKIVRYDLERAVEYRSQLSHYPEQYDYSTIRHACHECIHHSCSAILAFYGSYIGPNPAGPLFNLINMLDMFFEEGSITLWKFCKVSQIEGDLQAVGMSLSGFKRLLTKTGKHIKSTVPDTVEHLVDESKGIFETTSNLITDRDRLNQEIHESTRGERPIMQAEYQKLVEAIMRRIPRCRIWRNDEACCFWLIHDGRNRLFRSIKSHILVLPVYTLTEVDPRSIEETRAVSERMTKDWEHRTNTVLYVCYREYTEGCRKYVENLTEPGWTSFLLTLEQLLSIQQSSEPIERFSRCLRRSRPQAVVAQK